MNPSATPANSLYETVKPQEKHVTVAEIKDRVLRVARAAFSDVLSTVSADATPGSTAGEFAALYSKLGLDNEAAKIKEAANARLEQNPRLAVFESYPDASPEQLRRILELIPNSNDVKLLCRTNPFSYGSDLDAALHEVVERCRSVRELSFTHAVVPVFNTLLVVGPNDDFSSLRTQYDAEAPLMQEEITRAQERIRAGRGEE